MYTIEQRDALRDHLLQLAATDARIVAAAVVGSLAVEGGGDRFSDLDLTFAVIDGLPTADVLADWSRTLSEVHGAVSLVDLVRGLTTYRVFLLPESLQCDLSLTPAAQFRPAGPRFRLLFGQIAEESQADAVPSMAPAAVPVISIPTSATATDLFGWGVIYALHARACIGRGRVWQAEHYVGAVRDHALALACLRHGLTAVQARGYDDLPAEVLARFATTHVGAAEPAALRPALAASTRVLLREGAEAQLPHAASVARCLAGLAE